MQKPVTGVIKSPSKLAASIFFKRLFPPTKHRPYFNRRRTSSMDLNCFKLCSGLKFLGYFMILLVAAIISVSYYVVVILTWSPKLSHGGFTSFLSILIVVLFHLLVSRNLNPNSLIFFFFSVCFIDFVLIVLCLVNSVSFFKFYVSYTNWGKHCVLLSISYLIYHNYHCRLFLIPLVLL